MAFERVVVPNEFSQGDALTEDLAGIGFNLAADAAPDPNTEDTLIAASLAAMEATDLRILDLLVTWLERHHDRVNADRLVRAVETLESERARAFWAAVGSWLEKDRRLSRLRNVYTGPRIDIARAGSRFLLRRSGEDPRFVGTPLRIPAGLLRGREADVLPPRELAKRHRTYYYRVLLGPTYRADMWAALEQNPELTPAELARRTYGSFATAWQVKRDWELLAACPTARRSPARHVPR